MLKQQPKQLIPTTSARINSLERQEGNNHLLLCMLIVLFPGLSFLILEAVQNVDCTATLLIFVVGVVVKYNLLSFSFNNNLNNLFQQLSLESTPSSGKGDTFTSLIIYHQSTKTVCTSVLFSFSPLYVKILFVLES